MIASILRLFALRPLFTLAIFGFPLLLLVVVGLFTILALKLLVFVVLPIAAVIGWCGCSGAPATSRPPDLASLLAVDLGVRTGLASYGDDGRLRWYRSHNFGSAARLRRAIPGLLDEPSDLARIVLEGGGPLAEGWSREAEQRDLIVQHVSAEEWRALFLSAARAAERRAGQGSGKSARAAHHRMERRAPTHLAPARRRRSDPHWPLGRAECALAPRAAAGNAQ